MTDVFIENIKLSDSSVNSFVIAENIAKSSKRKIQDSARKERRERINKLESLLSNIKNLLCSFCVVFVSNYTQKYYIIVF